MNKNHFWIAFASLNGIGPVIGRRLLDRYSGDIEAVFTASTLELQQAGLNTAQIAMFHRPDWDAAKRHADWLEKSACHLVVYSDEVYPSLLQEAPSAPLLLYVRGNTALLSMPQLAIVGSRHPTSVGLDIAESFARELALAGYIITSGLAKGIDAASHLGALSVGKTIGVLGTGLAHIYPAVNRTLAAKMIAEGGAIVSEFAPDVPPMAKNFPLRNRVISGLACGVLVVEAARRSGSLITARYALEQNREVFAIPGSIHNPLARGCHQLIREGAKLVESAGDILAEIGMLAQVTSLPSTLASAKSMAHNEASVLSQRIKHLPETMQKVLLQLGSEVTAPDVVVARTGLTAGEVSSILLALELEMYVEAVPGGYLSRLG